jgi:phosphate:Na+ symporter
VIELVSFGSDLEAAADIIDHQVISLAKKLDRKQMQFSNDDIRDLDSLHRNVVRAISLALGSFQTDDHALMEQVVQFRREPVANCVIRKTVTVKRTLLV